MIKKILALTTAFLFLITANNSFAASCYKSSEAEAEQGIRIHWFELPAYGHCKW